MQTDTYTRFRRMKGYKNITYVLALLAMMLISQSGVDVSTRGCKSYLFKTSLTSFGKAKPYGKLFNAKECETRNNIEIALSESRYKVSNHQEVFDFNPPYDFEFHKTRILNERLQSMKAGLLLTKNLYQLQVLLI